jgi:hypothetical protein
MNLDSISISAAVLCIIFFLSTVLAQRDAKKNDQLSNLISMSSLFGILIVAAVAIFRGKKA